MRYNRSTMFEDAGFEWVWVWVYGFKTSVKL
jgi:hypothetical protein